MPAVDGKARNGRRSSLPALCLGLALAVAGGALTGCAVDPGGGEPWPPLIDQEDEAKAGDREHRAVLRAHGGLYRNRGLEAMLRRVTERLAPHALLADDAPADFVWRVWLLDDPAPNAFALPGGRLYFSRGLLALLNDEAELASVVGHEMGHVVARHGTARVTAVIAAHLTRLLVGLTFGVDEALSMTDDVAELSLAAYSRHMESEADRLGAGYLAAAGYDPGAAPRALGQLMRWRDYQAAIGQGGGGFSVYQSHPLAEDRVAATKELAATMSPSSGGADRPAYLAALQGMAWGDAPAAGLVRGRDFVHPGLGLRFTAPPGYRLSLSARRLTAENPTVGGVILLDVAARPAGRRLRDYLLHDWAGGLGVEDARSGRAAGFSTIGGRATLTIPQGGRTAVLLTAAAIDDQRVLRVICAAPAGWDDSLAADCQAAVASLQPATRSDLNRATAERIGLLTTTPGDDVAGLAARLGRLPRAHLLLRAINGLDEGAEPGPGQILKTIVSD